MCIMFMRYREYPTTLSVFGYFTLHIYIYIYIYIYINVVITHHTRQETAILSMTRSKAPPVNLATSLSPSSPECSRMRDGLYPIVSTL